MVTGFGASSYAHLAEKPVIRLFAFPVPARMSDILFIKTSSLGDVIHHMPALTEARQRRPDARFAWLVEEAFAPLVRLHPAVNEVIAVAWRRWRQSLYAPATLSEIAGNLRAIRAPRYDEIVDSQGLLRTAVIARLARGRRQPHLDLAASEAVRDAVEVRLDLDMVVDADPAQPPFGEGVGFAGQFLEVRPVEFLEQRAAGDAEPPDRPLLVELLQ